MAAGYAQASRQAHMAHVGSQQHLALPSTSPRSAQQYQVFGSRSGSLAGQPLATRPQAGQPRPFQAVITASAGPGSKGTVAVTGATGLIGTKLVEQLLAQGYSVRALTRNPAAARAKLPYAGVEFVGPLQWQKAVAGTAAVVNLAGEPIATRWTAELKSEIKRSRVTVTKRLVVRPGGWGTAVPWLPASAASPPLRALADWARIRPGAAESSLACLSCLPFPCASLYLFIYFELLQQLKRHPPPPGSPLQDAINACPPETRPKVLVSSSAVGYYGNSDNTTFSEASGSGSDYLAEVRPGSAVRWESVL